MRVVVAIVAVGLGLMRVRENVEKLVDKYVSSFEAPKRWCRDFSDSRDVR